MIKCYIPKVVTEGVIKPVSLDANLNDIKKEIDNVSVVKRLKTKDGADSRAIKLTFCLPSLPSQINLGYQVFNVIPFVPPVFRCSTCNRLGHTKSACRARPTCNNCGKPDHEKGQCSNDAKCVNCAGNHPSSFFGCSEYKVRALAGEIKSSTYMPFSSAITFAREKLKGPDVVIDSPVEKPVEISSSPNPSVSYAHAVKGFQPSECSVSKDRSGRRSRDDNRSSRSRRSNSVSVDEEEGEIPKQPPPTEAAITPKCASGQAEKSVPQSQSCDMSFPSKDSTENVISNVSHASFTKDSDIPKFDLKNIVEFLESMYTRFIEVMKSVTDIITTSISDLKKIMPMLQHAH